MNGFFCCKGIDCEKHPLTDAKTLRYKDIVLAYSPLNKFMQDKLFFEDESKIVLLDGVIFNKTELMGENGKSDWQETFNSLYDEYCKEEPSKLINKFRGSFSGIIIDKANDTIFAYTNHSGEKTVYYTVADGALIIASHNNITTEIMGTNHAEVKPNIASMYEMLITGSILQGKTPFENVRRVTAGKYMMYKEGVASEVRYHMFRNVPEHTLSLEACVKQFDVLFRQAIERIYSKNKEYGYRAECDLSGGLDSRMATYVAHEMGYTDILNVSFGQSGTLDHTISKKIASDLGNEYFFLPLDGGNFLLDIDEMADKFGGQLMYIFSRGMNRAFKHIDTDNIGLACTGLLGELQNAYWTQGDKHTPSNYITNRRITEIELTVPKEYTQDYDNYEHMNLYEYSFAIFMTSAVIRQDKVEVFSPFVDKDLLEFSYKVPLKYRKDYLFSMTWMDKYYPKAAKYNWQTKQMPVHHYLNGRLYMRKHFDSICKFFKRVCNKLFRVFSVNYRFLFSDDTSPFDYWYKTNPEIVNFFERYFETNIGLVEDTQLKQDITKVFKQNKVYNKIYCAYVLAIYKRYFYRVK